MVGVMLALMACAGRAAHPKLFVHTEHDHDIAFGAYSTYAWVPDDASRTNPVFLDHPELPGVIAAAVDRELAAKGFEKTAEPAADFLVAMNASVQDVVVISRQRFHGWSRASNRSSLANVNTASALHAMAEGTLILEVIDVASEGVVWRSRAAGVVARREGIEQTVDAAVARMLEQFPPPS